MIHVIGIFYNRNKDGYSSLAKDGKCDIDIAVALVGTQSFTNKELNHATNGFSEEYKIGEGAFGEVFRGFLKRTQCAIKRLFPVSTELYLLPVLIINHLS